MATVGGLHSQSGHSQGRHPNPDEGGDFHNDECELLCGKPDSQGVKSNGTHSLLTLEEMISQSWLLVFLLLISLNFARADTAAFDLSGPQIQVRVTRGGKTLPISQVPNLQ